MLVLETFDAFPVGAAPLLIDDASTASPELALVDPDLADRLRSALAGPERWEARAEPEDAPPDLAAVVAHEELSPSESAPPPADVDELEDVEHESSEETESFAAHSTLPVSAEPEANHETDAFLRNIEASPERADPPLDDLADLIVYDSTPPAEHDRVEPAETGDDMSEAQPVNDYPALPTSGELDATIEATDATLRRMREHLTSDEPTRRPRRVGRFVTVSAGICAVGAVAVLAADTQLGLATLPGMLGF